MFIELNDRELEYFSNLTKEAREKAMMDDEIIVSADISIKVKRNYEICEEHKYYHVFAYKKCNLINDINVVSITEDETVFDIGNEQLIVKSNEDASIEIGKQPYSVIYEIKVNNVKYGKVVEL